MSATPNYPNLHVVVYGEEEDTMKRYVVTNQSSGVSHALCDTLGEAIASAVKLQDEGSRVLIVDSQGSGVIMVGHFDLLEAEGYLGRDLGSEQMDSDVPVAEVMISAKRTAPKKQIYHWDIGSSDMQ
jgi:hypothetical protein